MKSGSHLSIWFFTGLCLGVNGALIFATGIYELIQPPASQVVLSNLHANLWWGAVLLILGVFFGVRFSPARERARMAGNG
jgi:hypothetical protein